MFNNFFHLLRSSDNFRDLLCNISFTAFNADTYLIITEIVCLSVCNHNNITTNMIIPIVIIFIEISIIKKIFYTINTNNIKLYFYIYNQIVVYSVNRKVNLYIDLKKLILINICFVLLISCLINMSKNLIGES